MDLITTQQALPALRKRPSQSRSRALVEAVEQACLRILDESGEDSLTVARIADVSGVAVGSIYQYFPNKDAIIALLYERVLDQEAEQLLRVRERLRGVPLKSALREILGNIVRVETRLFKLNKAFHLRYHSALPSRRRMPWSMPSPANQCIVGPFFGLAPLRTYRPSSPAGIVPITGRSYASISSCTGA